MITKSDWGFILLEWVLVNILSWLFGYDIEWKYKVIIPQVITVAIILLMISFKLMGVE